MNHLFIRGAEQAPTMVLLHGTGGDEHALLSVGKELDEQASILSIRGQVNENGMNRFFKRLEEGIFDEEDLLFRAKQLKSFIQEMADYYGFNDRTIVLVGYSNGANIAIQLLLDSPKIFKKAILFHPMFPVAQKDIKDLSQTTAFLTVGKNDPIVPISESMRVIELLSAYQADLTAIWTASHQLTYEEVVQAKQWLENQQNPE